MYVDGKRKRLARATTKLRQLVDPSTVFIVALDLAFARGWTTPKSIQTRAAQVSPSSGVMAFAFQLFPLIPWGAKYCCMGGCPPRASLGWLIVSSSSSGNPRSPSTRTRRRSSYYSPSACLNKVLFQISSSNAQCQMLIQFWVHTFLSYNIGQPPPNQLI